MDSRLVWELVTFCGVFYGVVALVVCLLDLLQRLRQDTTPPVTDTTSCRVFVRQKTKLVLLACSTGVTVLCFTPVACLVSVLGVLYFSALLFFGTCFHPRYFFGQHDTSDDVTEASSVQSDEVVV